MGEKARRTHTITLPNSVQYFYSVFTNRKTTSSQHAYARITSLNDKNVTSHKYINSKLGEDGYGTVQHVDGKKDEHYKILEGTFIGQGEKPFEECTEVGTRVGLPVGVLLVFHEGQKIMKKFTTPFVRGYNLLDRFVKNCIKYYTTSFELGSDYNGARKLDSYEFVVNNLKEELTSTEYSEFFDKTAAEFPDTFYNNNTSVNDIKANRSLQYLAGKKNFFFCKKCGCTYSEKHGERLMFSAPARFHSMTSYKCPNNYYVYHTLSLTYQDDFFMTDNRFGTTSPPDLDGADMYAAVTMGTYTITIHGTDTEIDYSYGLITHHPDRIRIDGTATTTTKHYVDPGVPWLSGRWTDNDGRVIDISQSGVELRVTENDVQGGVGTVYDDDTCTLVFGATSTIRANTTYKDVIIQGGSGEYRMSIGGNTFALVEPRDQPHFEVAMYNASSVNIVVTGDFGRAIWIHGTKSARLMYYQGMDPKGGPIKCDGSLDYEIFDYYIPENDNRKYALTTRSALEAYIDPPTECLRISTEPGGTAASETGRKVKIVDGMDRESIFIQSDYPDMVFYKGDVLRIDDSPELVSQTPIQAYLGGAYVQYQHTSVQFFLQFIQVADDETSDLYFVYDINEDHQVDYSSKIGTALATANGTNVKLVITFSGRPSGDIDTILDIASDLEYQVDTSIQVTQFGDLDSGNGFDWTSGYPTVLAGLHDFVRVLWDIDGNALSGSSVVFPSGHMATYYDTAGPLKLRVFGQNESGITTETELDYDSDQAPFFAEGTYYHTRKLFDTIFYDAVFTIKYQVGLSAHVYDGDGSTEFHLGVLQFRKDDAIFTMVLHTAPSYNTSIIAIPGSYQMTVDWQHIVKLITGDLATSPSSILLPPAYINQDWLTAHALTFGQRGLHQAPHLLVMRRNANDEGYPVVRLTGVGGSTSSVHTITHERGIRGKATVVNDSTLGSISTGRHGVSYYRLGEGDFSYGYQASGNTNVTVVNTRDRTRRKFDGAKKKGVAESRMHVDSEVITAGDGCKRTHLVDKATIAMDATTLQKNYVTMNGMSSMQPFLGTSAHRSARGKIRVDAYKNVVDKVAPANDGDTVNFTRNVLYKMDSADLHIKKPFVEFVFPMNSDSAQDAIVEFTGTSDIVQIKPNNITVSSRAGTGYSDGVPVEIWSHITDSIQVYDYNRGQSRDRFHATVDSHGRVTGVQFNGDNIQSSGKYQIIGTIQNATQYIRAAIVDQTFTIGHDLNQTTLQVNTVTGYVPNKTLTVMRGCYYVFRYTDAENTYTDTATSVHVFKVDGQVMAYEYRKEVHAEGDDIGAHTGTTELKCYWYCPLDAPDVLSYNVDRDDNTLKYTGGFIRVIDKVRYEDDGVYLSKGSSESYLFFSYRSKNNGLYMIHGGQMHPIAFNEDDADYTRATDNSTRTLVSYDVAEIADFRPSRKVRAVELYHLLNNEITVNDTLRTLSVVDASGGKNLNYLLVEMFDSHTNRPYGLTEILDSDGFTPLATRQWPADDYVRRCRGDGSNVVNYATPFGTINGRTDASFNITIDIHTSTKEVTDITILNGGFGYSVGDTFTVLDPDSGSIDASFEVGSVDEIGTIQAVNILTAGSDYLHFPFAAVIAQRVYLVGNSASNEFRGSDNTTVIDKLEVIRGSSYLFFNEYTSPPDTFLSIRNMDLIAIGNNAVYYWKCPHDAPDTLSLKLINNQGSDLSVELSIQVIDPPSPLDNAVLAEREVTLNLNSLAYTSEIESIEFVRTLAITGQYAPSPMDVDATSAIGTRQITIESRNPVRLLGTDARGSIPGVDNPTITLLLGDTLEIVDGSDNNDSIVDATSETSPTTEVGTAVGVYNYKNGDDTLFQIRVVRDLPALFLVKLKTEINVSVIDNSLTPPDVDVTMTEEIADIANSVPYVVTPSFIIPKNPSDRAYYKYVWMFHPDTKIPVSEIGNLQEAYRYVFSTVYDFTSQSLDSEYIYGTDDTTTEHKALCPFIDCSEFCAFEYNTDPKYIGGMSLLIRKNVEDESGYGAYSYDREGIEYELSATSAPFSQKLSVRAVDIDRRRFVVPHHYLNEGDLVIVEAQSNLQRNACYAVANVTADSFQLLDPSVRCSVPVLPESGVQLSFRPKGTALARVNAKFNQLCSNNYLLSLAPPGTAHCAYASNPARVLTHLPLVSQKASFGNKTYMPAVSPSAVFKLSTSLENLEMQKGATYVFDYSALGDDQVPSIDDTNSPGQYYVYDDTSAKHASFFVPNDLTVSSLTYSVGESSATINIIGEKFFDMDLYEAYPRGAPARERMFDWEVHSYQYMKLKAFHNNYTTHLDHDSHIRISILDADSHDPVFDVRHAIYHATNLSTSYNVDLGAKKHAFLLRIESDCDTVALESDVPSTDAMPALDDFTVQKIQNNKTPEGINMYYVAFKEKHIAVSSGNLASNLTNAHELQIGNVQVTDTQSSTYAILSIPLG